MTDDKRLVELGLQRYQDSGDTLARKQAWAIERLSTENARLVRELGTRNDALKDIADICSDGNFEVNAVRRIASRMMIPAFLPHELVKWECDTEQGCRNPGLCADSGECLFFGRRVNQKP